MKYELADHARESLRKRPDIRQEWIERVLGRSDRIDPDLVDPELEHRLGRIDEYEGRVLRVIVKRNTAPLRVIVKRNTAPLRIITVYFDRKMRTRL